MFEGGGGGGAEALPPPQASIRLRAANPTLLRIRRRRRRHAKPVAASSMRRATGHQGELPRGLVTPAGGSSERAVVVTATVTWAALLPLRLMLAGVGVQVAPCGAPAQARAKVPVAPFTGVNDRS